MLDPSPVLASDEVQKTVAAIEDVQLPNGCIPWFEGGHADPWDHVEAAMALTVGGRTRRAEDAYRWLARAQRSDGAWAAAYKRDRIVDRTLDANFSSYVAVGMWHHWLVTGDTSFATEMWPVVERAIDFTLDLQADSGAILWARDDHYRPWPRGLLTSSSCIFFSLRCAIGLAIALGADRPDWELALEPLRGAIADKPDAFEPKDRYAMDWYYPVLGGALEGDAAMHRLRARWDHFVITRRGIRCVADRPWVTTAETCELVLALDAMGESADAHEMFRWVQHLRADDGAYWTGATFPDGTIWPREQPTWSSAVVVLAADALTGMSPASGIFRGEGLPAAAGVSEPVADSL